MITRGMFWDWDSRETMVSCWVRVRIWGRGGEVLVAVLVVVEDMVVSGIYG